MMYESDIITVAVVNFKVMPGNKESNLSRIKDMSIAAAKRGVDLILFPELCLLGYDYFLRDDISLEEKLRATETVKGSSVKVLEEVAKEYGIYIVFGMSEKMEEDSKEIYNSEVVVGAEGLVGSYQKIHPYGDENKWTTKGENPFMFDTKWGPISIGVCYDSFQFPELMRYYCWKGSRLYLNPTAAAEEVPNEGSRNAFIRCYAPHLEYGVLTNSIYIASSNLTGRDGGCYFGGGSMIIGPKTNAFEEVEVTCYAGSADEYQVGMFIGTIDLSLAVRHQNIVNPYTGQTDYRPEIYRKLFCE